MHLVDTHVHLDADAFADDLDDVLTASRDSGVTRWINVGYSERTWASSRRLAASTPGMSIMLGLHPGNADDWSDGLHRRLREAVAEARPVAIGEIGIDLYWRQDNLDVQRDALRAQLALARECGLPAVIHMRDADAALLEVLETTAHLPHIHFHSFDGAEELRAWLLARGATLGVGGLITRRDSASLRAWVAGAPRDRVTLETDAPYLKPRGIRGTRNQPAYMARVATVLAELWGIDTGEVARITTANAERVFRLGEEAAP